MRRSTSFSTLQRKESGGAGDGEDEEEEEEEEEEGGKGGCGYSILKWASGNKQRKPLINFSAGCVLVGTPREALETIRKYHLGYKFVKTECRLVRNILTAHGFKETGASSLHFNLMWTGTHLKPYTLRALTEHQKVNHFPRSYELTRKDRLYKNIQRMQHSKGMRHFDFVPASYVLTSELDEFYTAFLKDRGPWIVKPVASSRGRGIYLINNPSQIPVHDNVLVCKYIDNPLLVDGFKFDCRLYVAVTSFDPLRLYLYEEGLTRFSTVKYEYNHSDLDNPWMHLTNYSVNKTSEDYVRCEDPEVDDYGSKWSFSALLRHLNDNGRDVEALMARVEDVIIKTIIAGEMSIATACKMFVPHRGNCFELFGFDILIDENLKPWLLEVNLSPSLVCDSPLDLKIKSNLICDLFNLTGFVADDPSVKKPPKLLMEAKKRQRHSSVTYSSTDLKSLALKSINKQNDGLSNDERKILRETKEESRRKGGFVRIYPSPESWELYGSLQEHQTTHNRMLHSKLYPELWRGAQRPQSATYIARARNFSSLSKCVPVRDSVKGSVHANPVNFYQRFKIYQSKLTSWSDLGQYAVQNEGSLDILRGPRKSPSLKHVQSTSVKLQQGVLLNPQQLNYEERLLNDAGTLAGEKGNNGQLYSDIVKNGQYLSKFQAREAFAVYLDRVQHRLVNEISNENISQHTSDEELEKQEQQIDLIHKFLIKASCNLTHPIQILIPGKNLPIQERKKTLAAQLTDFVRVYNKETELLMEKEYPVSDAVLHNDSFQSFVQQASESELEDILTVFTKRNKSASIFLGTKTTTTTPNHHHHHHHSASKGTTVRDAGKDHDETVIRYTSSEGISVGLGVTKESSKKLNSDSGVKGGGEEYKKRTDHNNSSLARDMIRTNTRSKSADRLDKLTTVCAYTGAGPALRKELLSSNSTTTPKHKQHNKHQRSSSAKSRSSSASTASANTSSPYKSHVFGVDDPRLRKALKSLSLRQAERTYSSSRSTTNVTKCDRMVVNDSNSATTYKSSSNGAQKSPQKSSSCNDLTNSSHNGKVKNNNNRARDVKSVVEKGSDKETLERILKCGQQFLEENAKAVSVDPNNFLQHSTSTQTTETSYVPNQHHKPSTKYSSKQYTSTPSNVTSYLIPNKHIKPTKKKSENSICDLGLGDNFIPYNCLEPRPPGTKKPVTNKQIPAHRMSRYVNT